MPSDPSYFVVGCHGWSGSYWLAHALNLHPELTVSHSAENLLAVGPDLHDLERLKATVQSLHHGMQARQRKPIDATFDEIEAMGDTPVYGAVHVFRLRDLPVQLKAFGAFKRPYVLANLVRHPVSFAWSGYGQLRDMFTFDIFVLRGTLNLILSAEDFIFPLAKRHDLNLADFEVASFLGGCANMLNLAQDVAVGRDVSHIKMESVTTDPELFAKVVSYLSGGKVTADATYLDAVYSTGEINKHRKGTSRMGPSERYESFSPWQKEAFNFFLAASGIRAPYESLGYDFSFVDKKGARFKGDVVSKSPLAAAVAEVASSL